MFVCIKLKKITAKKPIFKISSISGSIFFIFFGLQLLSTKRKRETTDGYGEYTAVLPYNRPPQIVRGPLPIERPECYETELAILCYGTSVVHNQVKRQRKYQVKRHRKF